MGVGMSVCKCGYMTCLFLLLCVGSKGTPECWYGYRGLCGL